MAKIIGNTTATPNPQPDWEQTNQAKADYIKNKPTVLTEDNVKDLIDQFGGDIQVPADWSQNDQTQKDYIKNKPTLGTLAAKDHINVGDIDCGNNNNGKFLQVVNGVATWTAILSAEDNEF